MKKNIPHESQVKRPKGVFFIQVLEHTDKTGPMVPIIKAVGPVEYAHRNGLNPYNLMSNHGKPANAFPKRIQWIKDKNGKPKKITHYN